jgi:glycerol kinase
MSSPRAAGEPSLTGAMDEHCVLAIDQGTSATKCLLASAGGTVLRKAAAPLDSSFPRPGWVEQDAELLWRSVVQAVRSCTQGLPPGRIAAVALSTQRESALLWDRNTGAALSPLLGWQDQRTIPQARRLLADGHADLVRARSGLPLDPMFSALKAGWLLADYRETYRHDPDERVAFGTVDSFLLARLGVSPPGGTHATEAGNASRTQLMDTRRRCWDPELLEIFGVPAAVLPRITTSGRVFGEVTTIDGLQGQPVCAVLGDSHAALYAHGPSVPGIVKATYGTGSSVMSLVAADGPAGAADIDPGIGLTLAWETDEPAYALEGNIRSAGATLTWLSRATEVPVARLAELASGTEDPGIHIVPAFTGLGAPWWDTDVRGHISGLTFDTDLARLARAALESTAYQVADVVDAMARSRVAVAELVVDGGASANDALMQFQADLCGVPVVRPAAVESSALGAARLAATVAGLPWPGGPGSAEADAAADRFEPRLSNNRRADLLGRWHEAVRAAVGSAR